MPPAYLAGPPVNVPHVKDPTCAGKVGFDSPLLATRVRDRSDKLRAVYRCSKCNLWHLGRTQMSVGINAPDAFKLGLIRRDGRHAGETA